MLRCVTPSSSGSSIALTSYVPQSLGRLYKIWLRYACFQIVVCFLWKFIRFSQAAFTVTQPFHRMVYFLINRPKHGFEMSFKKRSHSTKHLLRLFGYKKKTLVYTSTLVIGTTVCPVQDNSTCLLCPLYHSLMIIRALITAL